MTRLLQLAIKTKANSLELPRIPEGTCRAIVHAPPKSGLQQLHFGHAPAPRSACSGTTGPRPRDGSRATAAAQSTTATILF